LEEIMSQNDKELVDKITSAVLSRLKSQGLSSTGDISQPSTSDRDITLLAKMIDHTLLKPEATREQIKQLCDEAVEYGFASVCVNSGNVTLAYEYLKNTAVPVCCTVGFPLGATTTKTKVFETKEAIENGAKEIDMVINIGSLKSRDYDRVKSDIEEVVIAARGKATVKVIIETCLLTDEEKVKACELAAESGADFVKTSTGFSTGGATVEDIKLMRSVVGSMIGVKASGGIGDYDTAQAMLDAGACTLGDSDLCRLGTSRSIKIVRGS
jgi:deoxyribose-phosphate aldolase